MKNILVVLLLVAGISFSSSVKADNLVQILMDQLGVTESQAKAGSGAIFSWAQESLSESDFAEISAAVPNMDEILGATPELETATAFGDTGNYTGLSRVVKLFEQLNMNSKMVMQFKPVLLDYVKENGGQDAYNLLAGVFNS